MDSQATYGYNVMFLCYMLNRDKQSGSTFLQNIYVKKLLKITNKRAPFDRSVDLKAEGSKRNLLGTLY